MEGSHNTDSLKIPTNARTSARLDAVIEQEIKNGQKLDPDMDPKKFRRIISNRISARKSRLKTIKHDEDLQNKAKDLQELISALCSKVKTYGKKKILLQLQNHSLKKELENRSNELRLRQIEVEENKAELQRLKEELIQKNNEISKKSNYPDIEFYKIALQNLQKNSQSSNHQVIKPIPRRRR